MASGKREFGEQLGKFLGGLFGKGTKKAAKETTQAMTRREARELRGVGTKVIKETQERLRAMDALGGRTGSYDPTKWGTPREAAVRRLFGTTKEELPFGARRIRSKIERGKPLSTAERAARFRGDLAENMPRTLLRTAGKYGSIGTGAGAAGLVGYNLVQGFRTPEMEPISQTAADIAAGADETPTQDPYDRVMEIINAAYDQGDPLASQARASLQDYLNNMNKYVAAQAPAVRKAYEDLAADAAREAAIAYASGQGTAGEVDALYQAAANQAAAYGAGQGVSAPAGETAGLTGVSGEMATAPQETAAYGASLADYLGRSAGITRDDLLSAARSYEAAGIGSEAQLRNMAAMAGAQREYELGQRLAEYAAQREDARRQALLNAQLAQVEYEQQMTPQVTREERIAFTVEAESVWSELTDKQRERLIKFYGSKEGFVSEYVNNPDLTRTTAARVAG